MTVTTVTTVSTTWPKADFTTVSASGRSHSGPVLGAGSEEIAIVTIIGPGDTTVKTGSSTGPGASTGVSSYVTGVPKMTAEVSAWAALLGKSFHVSVAVSIMTPLLTHADA